MSEIIELSSDEEENVEGLQSVSISITKEMPLDICKIDGKMKHASRSRKEISTSIASVDPQQKVRQNGMIVKVNHGSSGDGQQAITHDQGTTLAELLKLRRKNEYICAPPVEKRQKIEAAEKSISVHKMRSDNNINSRSSMSMIPSGSGNDATSTRYRCFGNTYKMASNNKRTTSHVTEEDFLGQFECTYQKCGKYLRNNVTLMWHLWAHVVQQKTAEPEEITNLQICEAEKRNNDNQQMDDEEKTDVFRLHVCPECLLNQPNPHRIQLHYHRVHKRDGFLMTPSLFTCNICEQVIGKNSMGDHIQTHRPYSNKELDLPYSCRFTSGSKRCRFRVSTRAALIEHFTIMHKGTFVLLCPFCLQTFSVPAADRKKNRIKVKDYIRHILLHDIEKPLYCNQCVIRFPQSAEQALENHKNQHEPDTESKWTQWQISTKALGDIKKSKSILTGTDSNSQHCLECGHELKTFRDHITKNKLKKCPNCDYATCCKQAFMNHQKLCICNPLNAPRWPYGQKPISVREILRCSICRYSTCLAQKMAEHIIEQCHKAKILTEKPTSSLEDDPCASNSHKDENTARNEELPIGQEKQNLMGEKRDKEQLNEFLSTTRVNEVMGKKTALKYLLADEQEEKNDQKINAHFMKKFSLSLLLH